MKQAHSLRARGRHNRGVTINLGKMDFGGDKAALGRTIADLTRRAEPRRPTMSDEERALRQEEANAERAERVRAYNRGQRIAVAKALATGAVLFAIVAAILALIFLAGCGATWQDTGRRAIEIGAVVTEGGDVALASAATSTCMPLVHEMPVGHDRDAAVTACFAAHDFGDAQEAVHVADAALRSAQATLDAADAAHDQARWTAALPCMAKAVADALVAIADAGVALPAELSTGRALVESFASQCNAGGPP